MDVDFAAVTLRFARPLPTAFGELRERELLTLRIKGDDEVVGWGEAAPLEPYDGVSREAVRAALAAYEPILRAGDGVPAAELLEACRAKADLPQALAAVDMALWDRAGNREGKPVSALLSDDPAPTVRVNATIAAEDRAEAAAQAAAAARAGFTCVKIKVGIGDDAGRVAAVRAAVGPGGRAAPGRQRRLERRGGRASDRGAGPGRARAGGGARARRRGAARSARPRRRARGDGRDGAPVRIADREGGRRRVPEGVALRRHLRPAGPGRPRPRLRAPTCTSPRPSTARWGSRPPCTAPPPCGRRPPRAWGRSSSSRTSSTCSSLEDGAIAVPAKPGSASSRTPGHRAQAAAPAADSPRVFAGALLTEGRWRLARALLAVNAGLFAVFLAMVGARPRRAGAPTALVDAVAPAGAHPPLGGRLPAARDQRPA